METEAEHRLRDLEHACRRAGARVTHQRREVLRAVVEVNVHPSAQLVLQRVRRRMPTISFDTIYRTLSFLEEHKLIQRTYAADGTARFDGNQRPHHHFICTKCGKIVDFESEEADQIALPDALAKTGTAITRQLQVSGTCRECEVQEEDSNG